MCQKDVAKALHINQWTLIGWEKGTKHISTPATYPRVIKWLGYDPFPKPETDGEELRQARLRRGLTAQEAADELGIDQGTWLRFENGQSVLPETKRRLLTFHHR